ncbi:MAG: glycosyltransferase family 4 protein [Verrucomicrobiota bacterium]
MRTPIDFHQDIRNLILVVRADPIICGHSTEARNLAEAAIDSGLESVHIVSYTIDTLQNSSLPLKPLETISAYSDGITVDRPEPVGDYKVLDQRHSLGISGRLVELLYKNNGGTMLMDLYLVPHGQMTTAAVTSFRQAGTQAPVVTVGEAVGSDITNVVGNAIASGNFGAAQIVLSNYLEHDLPVAVSKFTRDLIIDAGEAVDDALGTNFAPQLDERVEISFPAIDTSAYTEIENQPERVDSVLKKRGLTRDGYVMFLSRIAPAKGVDDLIEAYRTSELYGKKQLIICGNGPSKEEIQAIAATDSNIRVLDDVSDEEKGVLMHACYAWCLPSKARPEFTETFGIAVAEKMLAGGLGPVITTRTGGIPEASGGNCLEHKAGDAADLRRCLNLAATMTDDERLSLSQRARSFALQFDRAEVLANLMSKTQTAGNGSDIVRFPRHRPVIDESNPIIEWPNVRADSLTYH